MVAIIGGRDTQTPDLLLRAPASCASVKHTRLDDLPLFADDRAIGQALLGAARAAEWASIVPIYERRGFPAVDPIMQGRYIPAVRAFFDREYGLGGATLSKPHGTERPETWNAPRRQGSNIDHEGAARRSRTG